MRNYRKVIAYIKPLVSQNKAFYYHRNLNFGMLFVYGKNEDLR